MRLAYPEPELTDGVVVLRRWSEADLPCVEDASRDPRIVEGTSVPARYTEQEGRAWIERQWSRATNGEGLSLAIADAESREALGAAVLMLRPEPGTVGLGYWVIGRARRRGLAGRAIALLTSWALTAAGVARVEALVEPDNVASKRVLERAGFRREGHLRSYFTFGERRADVLIYSLLPRDVG